jgi:hypothetical protein
LWKQFRIGLRSEIVDDVVLNESVEIRANHDDSPRRRDRPINGCRLAHAIDVGHHRQDGDAQVNGVVGFHLHPYPAAWLAGLDGVEQQVDERMLEFRFVGPDV